MALATPDQPNAGRKIQPNKSSVYAANAFSTGNAADPTALGFEYFVEFHILSLTEKDVHVSVQANTCQSCAADYEVIGKYETMDEDRRFVDIII